MRDAPPADVQANDEAVRRKALGLALGAVQTAGDVIVGPWTGEVGFELLYWIPVLTWLAERGPGGRRMIVVSRGGAASWYRHLTPRYVDILDLVTADEFRVQTAGKKKQYERQRGFDQALLQRVRALLDLDDAAVVHPFTMFRLFAAVWRRRASIDVIDAFSAYQALGPVPPLGPAAGLPAEYVAAKFYFSKAFPDTQENRAFVARTLRSASRHLPVVLLSTSVRLDEHADFEARAGSGVYVVDAHVVPQRNLELQTRIVSGARGFLGTYGGFSYLAPFHGVPSLSFFSRPGFEPHHLALAHRVFDRLFPGGFLARDRRDSGDADPLAGWVGRVAPTRAGA
jgi:hypothetical protein